jgi:branched-chain amino acid transport system permease protein
MSGDDRNPALMGSRGSDRMGGVPPPVMTRRSRPGWVERPSREHLVVGFVVLALLIVFPVLHPGYRYLSLAISTGFTAIALYGLSLQFGQAGIMSVGHAGIMGIGGYTAAILSNQLGFGFWEALPFSILLSAIAAALVGLPALRVGGQHYIIITFCFCALLEIALTNGGTFTGAATGLDVWPVKGFFGIKFAKLDNLYYLVIAALVLTIMIVYSLVQSPYGRTLWAIRENEPLARAVGINTNLRKIGVFALSGAFAGLGGILQAYYLRHISPTLYGAFPSLYLALMVMLGGARPLYGPLIGAIIVTFLPEIGGLDPIDSRIAYGVGLLLVILLLPGGVSGGVLGLYRSLLERRGSARHQSRCDSVEMKD